MSDCAQGIKTGWISKPGRAGLLTRMLRRAMVLELKLKLYSALHLWRFSALPVRMYFMYTYASGSRKTPYMRWHSEFKNVDIKVV